MGVLFFFLFLIIFKNFLFYFKPGPTTLLFPWNVQLLLMNQRVSVVMYTHDWVMFRPKDDVSCSTSVTQALASDHSCIVCELCCAGDVLCVVLGVSWVVCVLCCV